MLGHQSQHPAAQQQTTDAIMDEDAKKVQETENEFHIQELVTDDTALSRRMAILKEIKVQFDKNISLASPSTILQRATFGPVLKTLSLVKSELQTGGSKSEADVYRSAVIEMIGRIPIGDIPRSCIPDLVKCCHVILEEDNEDNGIIAQRILADVHKSYKQGLEDITVPYFNWLLKLFAGLGESFDEHMKLVSSGNENPVLPSVQSIKIAQDIAVTVFSLFQAYPKRLNQYGQELVSVMVAAASIAGPTLEDVPLKAMQVYTDFRMTQIKTLTFLMILSKSHTAQAMVLPHKDAMCSALVRIMQTSSDNLMLRKELLNGLRTMLGNDELKSGLSSKVDDFLDMDTLVGTDKAISEGLRQAAFVHLTELVLMCKADLNVQQITKVVDMAIQNLLDVTLTLSLHVTCVRVLYQIVVEILFPRRAEDVAYRAILSDILGCMAAKLEGLCFQIPRIIAISGELEGIHQRRKASDAAALKSLSEAGIKSLANQESKIRKLVEDYDGKGNQDDVETKEEEASHEQDEMDIDPQVQKSSENSEKMGSGKNKQNDGSGERVLPTPPFKTVYQGSTNISVKERELLEFRNLAHGLLNTTKTVTFVIIVFHTSRGLKSPVPSHMKPWSSKSSDVRLMSQIMELSLRFITFFEHLVPPVPNFDPREVLAEMFSAITDANEFADVFTPNLPFIFEITLSNMWYLPFLKSLLEDESPSKLFSNRYAVACLMNFLVQEKLHTLKDIESREGALTLQILQMCFEALPRIQSNDAQRSTQLAQYGVPGMERAALPHVISFLKHSIPYLQSSGKKAIGFMKAIRSLFYALAMTNKFLDIQASIGLSGLHAQIVDISLSFLNGPASNSKETEEMSAEICLLVPARLEHLIPLIPRMMHAAVRALNGSDRSVQVALRVLDIWVESFNPEFIERSMASVTQPLMTALWKHIKPSSQGAFGHKVAEMLGKMGGRGRRWIEEKVSVDYKDIPEYGLRVILAFPPHTSFLVPLDRCVQLAWNTISSTGNDPYKRKNALKLLQICAGTLTRMHLPSDMLEKKNKFSNEDDNQESKETIDARTEENFTKFEDLLFTSKEAPAIPADLVWPAELGVKTKKQHAAEKHMLRTVLTALMASSSIDDQLKDCNAKAFAHATCRHFAYLMAAGWAEMAIPPSAPPSSRIVKYDVLGGIPAHIATLKHLQPHVLLDAFQEGLKQDAAWEREAVIECMSVFLDTLIAIGRVQISSNEQTEGEEEDYKSASLRERLSKDLPYFNVLQDLITRARHCCYGDTWSSRMGGVMALDILADRMPRPLLLVAAHYITRALMAVLRSFPDNALEEIDLVTSVTEKIVTRALSSRGSEEEQKKDEPDEDTEQDDMPATRRGKRGKKSTGPTSRKKQKTSPSKQSNEKANDDDFLDRSKGIATDKDASRLQNDLLQAVMSSKNNDAVRKAASKCLEILAKHSGTTVGAMLDQILKRQPASKSLLERRILPLRSLPTQANYAMSLAFLLRNCPNELELTPSLGAFIADSCTVLEIDENNIASTLSVRGQTPKPDMVSKLQVACLEVLVAALEWPAFSNAKDVSILNHIWDSLGEVNVPINQIRDRMARVFIRRLGSNDERQVSICQKGIKISLEKKLLEKTVLQEALRPVLVDLSVYQRLSLGVLNHVHRLLDLLSEHFTTTIGQKITEHLQMWIEADKYILNGTSNFAWEAGTEWQIATKLLEIFHKLPPAAVEYLETHGNRPGLMVLVIGLEDALPSLPGPALPSKRWSPYRDALVKFLNRYSQESMEYFLKSLSRLATPEYFLRLLDILKHPSGKPLLEKVQQSADVLCSILEAKDSGKEDELKIAKQNCVILIHLLSELSPDWLDKTLFDRCLEYWKDASSSRATSGILAKIMTGYIRRNQDEVETLLQLPDAFHITSGCDLTEVKEYLVREFPRESSIDIKRKVLAKWIDTFATAPDQIETTRIRLLLKPMITWLVTHDQKEALTPDIVSSIVNGVFGRISSEENNCSDLLQSEVVQICVQLVEHVPNLLREYKKQVIQYVWWTLKKDNIAKAHAFLCVSHFFKAYQRGGSQDENDTKLILKAFFNMVRMSAHDSASREAVKQAIDHIIPILSEESEDLDSEKQASSKGEGEDVQVKKKPPYPSVLKRLLQEEGLYSPVMVLVMQMVVRNREAFYSSRVAFIPVMLATLNRLGLPNASTIDNRMLAVDMAVTMYWWDEKAKIENERSNSTKATRLTKDMDTNILNFLLRMAFVSCEVRDRDETGWKKLHAHCLNTLRDAARFRPNTVFKLSFFDKLLQNSNQQQQQQLSQGKPVGPTPVLVTGLRIVSLFMEFQPENLTEHCQHQILLMIEPSIYSKNVTTIELFSTVLKSMYKAFPSDISKLGDRYAATLSIQGHLLKVLTKFLNYVSEVEQFTPDTFWHACNCVRAMKGATEGCPKSMEKVLYSLLRAVNRIAKEHSKQPQLGLLSAKGPPQETLTISEFGTGAWFMHHSLSVAVPSSLILSAEHRKMFLSTVVELMAGNPVRQGQTHSGILFSVMHLLRDWLLSGQNYLNPKESLVLLQRLAQVDRLHAIPSSLRQVWDKDFLDFLYTLITKRKENNFGDEVFLKVERPFCCGLQNANPDVRNRFFKLYSERVPRDLYERLKYIISVQEWEFLSNTFWLKHAVALLFDCLHMKDSVTLAYNSAHVPQLFNYKESLAFPAPNHDKNGGVGVSGTSDEPEEKKEDDDEKKRAEVIHLPDSVDQMLRSHLQFLREQSDLRSEALVSCLIEQVQTDPEVAHHLWVLLFPIVWTSLEKEQQTGLAKPIIQLLSKEHHVRQSLLRPTVGQTLLDGISMSQPQPKIPAEMIKYMGKHFHAWHTAISMLESHVGLFPQDMRCFDAVCDLYAILDEEDMRCGLWQRRASAPETATAMALQQHGFIPQAQTLYLEMMSRGVSGDVSGFTKSEMVLWHNQYLSCCMELNQWDTVAEYAKSVDNSTLRLEAAAKLYDWSYLKTIVGPNVQVEEGAEFTMVKAQMQMSDMTLLDVDKLCKSALSQCILKWWQMPECSPWSHASVLHSFQRAVELMESWRVMMEFSMQGGTTGHYQDLKDIADTWKLRTPNEWESVRWWSDILTWRNHVYNTTIRQFSNMQTVNPNLHQLGYRDKAWSVNRLGHVARLHHLPDVCINIINTLYGFNAMEVQEAFIKVQEQAKAYMQLPHEHIHGLNLINSTNLDYFQPAHHAEMLSLKGQFLHLLGDDIQAHDAFSEALTLWPVCSEGWLSWARFCDDQYTSLRNQKQQSDATGSNDQQGPQFWLEYCAACYVQAIKASGTEGRSLVPRLLHLLMLDINGPEFVGKHVSQHALDIPAWVWLPWVPQLVVGLQRPEHHAAKRLLATSAAHYPQYVYWYMRVAINHLKEVALKAVNEGGTKQEQPENQAASTEQRGKGRRSQRDKARSAKDEEDEEMPDAQTGTPEGKGPQIGSSTTPGGGPAPSAATDKLPEIIAYESAKEVMDSLRAKLFPPLQTLDLFISELGQRFTPRTDERLLAVVHTLQHRAYRIPLPSSAPIPESLSKELASVCKACSGVSSASNPGKSVPSGPWSNWNKYQIEFAKDLDMTKEGAPKTLGELGNRLKGWRTMMASIIEDTNPPILRLEDLSPGLIDVALDEVEMPCQISPSPDGPETVFIERMSADVDVVRRACSSSRRVSIVGSDGQTRRFLIAGQQSGGHGSGEERVGQALRAANSLLASHPESRRRGLAFAAPRSQALLQTGRITEDDPSSCLFIDAYETYCARYGKDADEPVRKFKEDVYQGGMEDEEARRKAYALITEEMVNENVFSQYMYKTMVENSRMMWTFKRQFALSTALSSVACFVLRLAGRTPSKIVVSKETGELTHLELVTVYNDRLQLDIGGETVPFRFTRNMSTFIGPHGLEGALVAAGVAAAQALQQEKSSIPSLLALFLRDDILAFIQRRLQVRSIGSIATVSPSQVENAVSHNVAQCLMRLDRVGPRNSVNAPVDEDQLPKNPQKNMRDLLAMASNPQNLSKMDPLWQPWL